MLGWHRFILHLLVVSVLGPAIGAGIYSFARAQWGNADLLSRFVGSLMGGFVLLVFIAPITVAVGIATYGCCWVVTQMGVLTQTWLWTLLGGAFGAAYASVWADYFVHGHRLLLVSSGTVIGFTTGAILALLWKRENLPGTFDCHD
jgi:hypothetical protein